MGVGGARVSSSTGFQLKITMREGSLEAPTRHPLDWRNPAFYDPAAAGAELERIFNICHACRRCVNLSNAVPTLFDLLAARKGGASDGLCKARSCKPVDHGA